MVKSKSRCDAFVGRRSEPRTILTLAVVSGLVIVLANCSYGNAVDSAIESGLAISLPINQPSRPVNSHDMISLRDIGDQGQGGISVSPDGAFVAFHVRQGDASSNRYQTGWFVASTMPGSGVTPVGDGGEVILAGEATGLIGGSLITLEARWSPDSQWIAYRLKLDGEVQLWRSSRDGRVQEQLTRNAANVSSFAWSKSGDHLFFEVGRSRKAVRDALVAEGQRGYVFDDRFMVGYGTSPTFPDPKQTDPFEQEHVSGLWVYDLQSGEERAALEADQQAYERLAAVTPQQIDRSRSVRDVVYHEGSGATAWLENDNPQTYAGFRPPVTVFSISADGTHNRCHAEECNGLIERPVWSHDGQEIFFARREGVNGLQFGLYAWRPSDDVLRTILKTDDWIEDCERSEKLLVCLHEGPTAPRKIVTIDPSSGSIETLFDPNPEFDYLTSTQVEKLEWKEASGADAAGHLVYPLGYEAGHRYPLIIVQYRSRGFLRGGVGNENPIHPLAANGYFVLSFDRPEMHDVAAKFGNMYDAERQHWGEDLWERTSALSALEIMIDTLDGRGLVDPKRVGITGLSDGVETLWYALIHSDRFAAASASAGGWSPSWYYMLNSTARENYLKRSAELLPPGMGSDERWRRISPEFHADSINTPVLLQVPDQELVVSAATIGALMDAGKPVEAYVFPDEYHIKWQPKHKLVVYDRTIDWFNFWLRHVEDPDGGKAEQYARWRKLRTRHCYNLKAEHDSNLPVYCHAVQLE